jgi:copper transport protein
VISSPVFVRTRSKCLGGIARRLFAIVLLILLPELPQAAAHAVLLEHFPGENETLATSPGEVWLRFNEPVTPVLVHVLNSEGGPVVGPDVISSRDTTVRIHLPSDLKAGSYVVSYRVRSADSHAVGGSFVFAVGERADAGLGKRFDRTPASATWLVLAVALRAVFYAASLIGIGAALFRLLVDPRRGDGHLILTACLAAVTTLIALLGVEGGMSAGASLTGILDPAIWQIGSRSTLGLSVLITSLGLGLVAFSPYTSSRRLASGWVITGAVVAISGFAVTGHIATAAPQWLTGPALAVHVLCAAFWIGALLPLYRRLGDEPAAAAAIVMRFSQVAVAMVGILLAAGVIIACIQVQTPAALGDTTYGQRLLAKLILVASLLLLAAVNKWRLTPRLAGGDPGANAALRRAIIAELALAGGVLVITAMLGQTPPPRVLAAAHEHHVDAVVNGGFTVAIPNGYRIAVLDVSPAHAGTNSFSLTLSNSDGSPMHALGVTLRTGNPAFGIEPSEHTAYGDAPGHYTAKVVLPIAGTWNVEISALISDFEQMTLNTTVPIQ